MSPRAGDSMYSPEQHGIANALAGWGKAIMPNITADDLRIKMALMQQEEVAKRLGETTQSAGNIREALEFIAQPAAVQQERRENVGPYTPPPGQAGVELPAEARANTPENARTRMAIEALSAPRLTSAWKQTGGRGGEGYTLQKVMKDANAQAEAAMAKLMGSLDKLTSEDADAVYTARFPSVKTEKYMQIFRSSMKRIPTIEEAREHLGPDFNEAAYGKWAVTPIPAAPSAPVVKPQNTGGVPGVVRR